MSSEARADTFDRAVALIRRVARDPAVAIRPETRLVADLGLESVQVLELVCAVERGFGIAIDAEDAAPVVTVADLVDAIEART